MFTVYDSKAEAYLPPIFFKTAGEALRVFADTCNDKNHQFNKHPGDFTLFAIGDFDDGNATLALLPTPTPLAKAVEYVQSLTEGAQINALTQEEMKG